MKIKKITEIPRKKIIIVALCRTTFNEITFLRISKNSGYNQVLNLTRTLCVHAC